MDLDDEKKWEVYIVSNAGLKEMKMGYTFNVGDEVKVIHGVLKGLIGRVKCNCSVLGTYIVCLYNGWGYTPSIEDGNYTLKLLTEADLLICKDCGQKVKYVHCGRCCDCMDELYAETGLISRPGELVEAIEVNNK